MAMNDDFGDGDDDFGDGDDDDEHNDGGEDLTGVILNNWRWGMLNCDAHSDDDEHSDAGGWMKISFCLNFVWFWTEKLK